MQIPEGFILISKVEYEQLHKEMVPLHKTITHGSCIGIRGDAAQRQP